MESIFDDLYILDKVEEEFRKSNRKIQELNSNPNRADYNEKVKEVRKATNKAILKIFYNYAT